MNSWLLFFCIITCLSLIFWVAYPLIKSRRLAGNAPLDELTDERTSSLLKSLKSLYISKEEGKVAGDDFANIERRLMLELAKIYKTQGIDPPLSGQERASTDLAEERQTGHTVSEKEQAGEKTPQPSETERAAEESPTKETAREPESSAKFCFNCGAPREPRFRFCPRCGTGFKAA